MQSILRRLNSIFARGESSPLSDHTSEIPISDSQFNNYNFVIGSLFTYYNELPEEQKRKFASRVHQFKSTKKFHFIGLEGNDDTATLVSSSAVQVTFGLKNYLLLHFKDIYVLADAYRMDEDE